MPEYKKGELVVCPPSGPHPGNRIGKIDREPQQYNGNQSRVVCVIYIDYPQKYYNRPGWYFEGAWVRPVRKIKWESEQ